MVLRKGSTILISVVLALFLLSGSIALPILDRELYYTEITRLELVKKTGYSEETIREAYDEMMDYCTKGGEKAGKTFRTGSLAFSASGKDHFDDVERLFHLDLMVWGVSGILLFLILILLIIIKRKTSFRPWRFWKRGPLFWGPVGLLVFCGSIGVLASIDFERFFVTFHHFFFPGKDNWIFYNDKDAIISILPQEVFQDFGLIVLGTLFLGCILLIILDFILEKRFPVSPDGRM